FFSSWNSSYDMTPDWLLRRVLIVQFRNAGGTENGSARNLHQPLSATRRATITIGEPRTPSVICDHDCLSRNRHFVNRPIGEVHDLFRMPHGEAGASALTPRIGGSG